MRSDLRIALRRLRRTPAFTVTAITTLALTLAASIALFAVVDAVLLRPLDYPAPDRLMAIRNRVDGIGPSPWGLSQAQYFDYDSHASALESIGVYVTQEFTFADVDGAERLPTASVSPPLFEVLRVRPALGRLLREDDVQPGTPATVAVLGHAFWVRRFGGDPTIIGRFINVEARQREVVGVLPAGFDLPDGRTAIWLPLQLDRNARPVNSHFLHAVGRLQPEASIDQARAELQHLVSRYSQIFPSAYDVAFMRDSRFAPEVLSLRDAVVGDVKHALWVLFAAAGVVLLIACGNLANLFLVRAQDRWHELQVRMALGAESRQLLGHALAEALLISLVAGALGIYAAVRPFYRVVGVAGNVREAGLDKPPVEAAYFPMIPMEGAPLWAPARAMTFVVGTESEDPTGLAGAIRGVLNELDRSVPLGNVTTMARIVEQSMSRTTLVLLLLGIAAGLGLLLATIGVYGVLAYTVSRKRKEIGIRTALGGVGSYGVSSRARRRHLVGREKREDAVVARNRRFMDSDFGVKQNTADVTG